MKERFFEAVRLFKGFLGILHPVEFTCDPEAMDAAALRIAKSRSESFVFCDPDRPDSVGYLQITGTSRGEEIIQFVEVAVGDCSPARSVASPGLRSETAVSGSLTNQKPCVICRVDGAGVSFIIKDRKLARQLNKYADGRNGGVLSRTGFKEGAVLSKICAVAVDVRDDEVCVSLRDGPALLELAAASQAGDALVLLVVEEFIQRDGDHRQGRTGRPGAKGLTAVAMFNTPSLRKAEESVPLWTPVTGRLKFAGLSKPVFVNLGDAKARRL